MTPTERRKRVQDALDRVAMTHRAKHYASSCQEANNSVSRLRARFGGNPPILLADEPKANLDSKNGELVMEQLRESSEGHAVAALEESGLSRATK